MELMKGKNELSEGTFPCDTAACLYHTDGRCIYNVARIQQRVSRACYNDLRMDEIEAKHDYEEGYGI